MIDRLPVDDEDVYIIMTNTGYYGADEDEMQRICLWCGKDVSGRKIYCCNACKQKEYKERKREAE